MKSVLVSVGQGIAPGDKTADGLEEIPVRRFVNTTLFIFLCLGAYFYWASIVLNHTYFAHGYQRFGTPPSPGAFLSARYGFDWWTIWLLSLNVLPPMMLCFALTNNKIETYTILHRWLAIMAIVVCIWCFVNLTWRWLLACNSAYSGSSSSCNDYRWCCVYFPSDWCPNNAMCTPDVTSSELGRNPENFQHWLFTFVFFVLAIWNYSINGDLIRLGVLTDK